MPFLSKTLYYIQTVTFDTILSRHRSAALHKRDAMDIILKVCTCVFCHAMMWIFILCTAWWKFLFVVHCSRFPVLKSLRIILGACAIFLRKHALICRGYWTEPDIFQRYFVWKYKFARICLVELIRFSQNLFHWRKWVSSLNSLNKTRKTLKATHLFKKNYDLFFLYFEKIWNKT